MFWLALAAVLLSLFLTVFNQINPNNFGPYNMIWEQYEMCKGPKNTNCGDVRVASKHNMSDIVFALDLTMDCPVTNARVTVGTKHANNTIKKMWNYAMDKPCQHFVLGPYLIETYNASSSCKISKGHYEAHLDMQAKSKMFLGTSFFYGHYNFRIMAFSKKVNFFCVECTARIEKK